MSYSILCGILSYVVFYFIFFYLFDSILFHSVFFTLSYVGIPFNTKISELLFFNSFIIFSCHSFLEIMTTFGTNRCEKLFSSLKFNKSKQSSSTGKHLNDCIKIITANHMSPNID
jgi:hypothetical protein